MKEEKKENLIERKNQISSQLPPKFFDEETGELNLEALVADYLSLVERDENLIETNLRHVPEVFDKYDIKINNSVFERDDEVLKKLYEKGFSNEQAQLVYDLAEEKVLPMLGDLTINFEAQKQLEKLISHFGSKEKFDEVARQISNWSRQNLSPDIYDILGSTSEGVLTLYRMMSSGEPTLSRGGVPKSEMSEEKLREMMKDPKYWRDKESSYIAKIQEGFQRLYPEK
ncbi:MAG: capsid assembly protein [Alphaproteobacteria bacterium]